jgi:hypothetical protein
MMRIFRVVLCGLTALSFCSIAAANKEEDGFVWIDANTRIKVKPVSTVKPVPSTAGSGASAPEKSPEKIEKKEKPAK